MWKFAAVILAIAAHEAQAGVTHYENDTVRVCEPSGAASGNVIFVQGYQSETSYYLSLLDRLCSSGIRVVSYDLIGQGASARLPGVTVPDSAQAGGGHFQAYVDQLKHVLNTYMGDRSYVAIGHSMGSSILLSYSMQNGASVKARMKRMILNSPYLGLPMDQFEDQKVFSANYLGVFGGNARILLWETLQEGAETIFEDPSLWGRDLSVSSLSDLFSQRLRVRICVRVLFGSKCWNEWRSVSRNQVYSSLSQESSYDSLVVNGKYPPLLALANLVQAHKYVNSDSNQKKLKGNLKRLSVYSSSDVSIKDTLTPKSVVQPYMKELGKLGVSVRSHYYGSEVSSRIANETAFSPAAHWGVMDEGIQNSILSEVQGEF